LDKYPGITRAALLVALDNGGINRDRSREDFESALQFFLGDRTEDNLPEIDRWLAGLSDDDLDTACCGEETEMLEFLKQSPKGTDALLNAIFEEVV